jgi:hypothetical protein
VEVLAAATLERERWRLNATPMLFSLLQLGTSMEPSSMEVLPFLRVLVEEVSKLQDVESASRLLEKLM